jgi:hypothetical protein
MWCVLDGEMRWRWVARCIGRGVAKIEAKAGRPKRIHAAANHAQAQRVRARWLNPAENPREIVSEGRSALRLERFEAERGRQ